MSVLFTSPLFTPDGRGGKLSNYSRVAFETDLPAIEDPTFSSNNNCDGITGNGCVDPPHGANFYPIYSTRRGGEDQDDAAGNDEGSCVWQLGGPYIFGTKNTFGGTSTAVLILIVAPPSIGFRHWVIFAGSRRVSSRHQ